MLLVAIRSRGVLQEPCEFLDAKVGLPYDSPKCSSIQLVVIWHNQLRKRFLASEDHMASMLAFQYESCFRESFDAFTGLKSAEDHSYRDQ